MPDSPAINPDDVLTQLVAGPSIREVAAKSLRTALDIHYPNLHIDPNVTMVVTPAWIMTDAQVVPGTSHFEFLTEVLVRLSLSGKSVTYLDGEHFLTRQPGVEPLTHLPVKINAVGCLLNTLAKLLFVAYQEQQLDYWNRPIADSTPRWHQLRDALHKLWNVDKVTDWDEDLREMALSLFQYPDKHERAAHDRYQTKACLIDIDSLDTATSKHSWVLEMAVLVGTLEDRTLVVTHSIAEGFKRYDSLALLGEMLSGRMVTSRHDRTLQWRLYEPAGMFFEHQAWALIALEIDAIGAFGNSTWAPTLDPQVAASANNFSRLHPPSTSRYSQIQHLLPDWLANASPTDLTRYSRHLMDLALLREQHHGQTFDEGIAALPDFALQALTDQMIKDQKIKDQAAATSLKLADIEVSITSLVVLGAVIVPGQTQTLKMSLADFALQNLAGLPLGDKTVQYNDGEAAPAWLTPACLEELVSTVNIGKTYPELIKNKLLVDPGESLRRQRLYTSQLHLQLPLLALQLKIRGGASGIDEQGYRYVVAALQEKAADRYVDGQEIAIRPLAFIPGGRSDNKADEVANMFLIGPKLADKGPCLLYRPLLDHPLTQYSSEANLLYAIKHDKALRQSVLAWLPQDLYFNYSQYVFPGELPSVWTLSQWLVDPTSTLGMMGAVTFSPAPLPEPPLQAVFNANANALVTLADRQSVSNGERRWATFKQGAWMLFNIALPFLGRTAGTAAWIWQIMDDLHEANEAREVGDSDQQWAALTDLFLSLGMVLAHHAASRDKPAPQTVEKVSTPASRPLPPAKITLNQAADVAAEQLPANHETSVYTQGLLPSVPLGVLLDSLAIAKPAALKDTPAVSGPHRFLIPLEQKWYARINQRWFEVMLNDNGDVQIIDSRQTPARTGPLLIHSEKGEWFVDTRLRLRGGGRARREIERKNQQHREDLRKQLTTFDARKLELQNELEAAEKAATDANRQPLLDLLDSQLAAYGAYIDQVKNFNAIEPIVNYRPVTVSCLDYQLLLTEKWFTRQNLAFGESMRRSLALLDNETLEGTQTPRQVHQLTSDMTQGYIEKIEFAHARIEDLMRLGKEAGEAARQCKAQLPKFDLQDLKLFQISLAQELCLDDSATVDTAPASQAMQRLVEDAGLTIQSSIDLAAQDHELGLEERIDGFNDLVEQYATLDQRIVDLPDEYSGQLLQPPLERMRQQIEEFKKRSERHLASLLNERRMLEPTPGPSRPAPAPRRVIKTRFKGTVVGKLRERTSADGTELLDVTSTLSGKVVTFHEKTPGVWLEHVSSSRAPEATGPVDLKTSTQTGQALLDELDEFTRRTEAHAKRPGRIPVEIEDLFQQRARRMEDAATAIEKALTKLNITDGGPGSAVSMAKQLNEGAVSLDQKGLQTRISMTKQQPPTVARVEWLHSQGLVVIVKTAGRKRLKGHRKDYLEEYEVRDASSAKVLWYAHFHYPTPSAAADAYSAAHLKTEAQRTLGGAFDLRTVSNNELIAIYRSEISPQLARSLFLPKAKTGGTTS
ncbi:dermonecrotic toxin domain-containing protein [Pseudomonas serbica]